MTVEFQGLFLANIALSQPASCLCSPRESAPPAKSTANQQVTPLRARGHSAPSQTSLGFKRLVLAGSPGAVRGGSGCCVSMACLGKVVSSAHFLCSLLDIKLAPGGCSQEGQKNVPRRHDHRQAGRARQLWSKHKQS